MGYLPAPAQISEQKDRGLKSKAGRELFSGKETEESSKFPESWKLKNLQIPSHKSIHFLCVRFKYYADLVNGTVISCRCINNAYKPHENFLICRENVPT